jgi:hypothetical protein
MYTGSLNQIERNQYNFDLYYFYIKFIITFEDLYLFGLQVNFVEVLLITQ